MASFNKKGSINLERSFPSSNSPLHPLFNAFKSKTASLSEEQITLDKKVTFLNNWSCWMPRDMSFETWPGSLVLRMWLMFASWHVRLTRSRDAWYLILSDAASLSLVKISRRTGSREWKWWCQSGRTARLVRDNKILVNNSDCVSLLKFVSITHSFLLLLLSDSHDFRRHIIWE